jgi:hypothetical protein
MCKTSYVENWNVKLKVENIKLLAKVKSLIWLEAIEDGGCRPNTSSKQVALKEQHLKNTYLPLWKQVTKA